MTYLHPFLEIVTTIRLPEYGYIGITKLEESIIDTFYFQRLRRIRQSPGVSLTYPGASHSRFEHSLGAMHIAGEAATHLIINTKYEDDCRPLVNYFEKTGERKEMSMLVQIARLGGLLHDIGHGPFSHTFEAFLELSGENWSHENLSMEIIWKKLKKCFEDETVNTNKVNALQVISLLCDFEKAANGKITINDALKPVLLTIGLKNTDIIYMEKFLQKFWYLNHLIKAEPYNADRLNYLILDSNRSGAVEYGAIDFERLIQNLHVYDDMIIVSTKARDAAIRFLEAYTHMYRSIYQHKTSYGADLHLAYAMYMAAKYVPSSIFGKLKEKHDLESILPLFDDVLLYYLNQITNTKCKPLIDDFFERKLLSQVIQTNDEKFMRLVDKHGFMPLSSQIAKKSKIKNAIVMIVPIIEKRASLPPLTAETLQKVSFLNTKTKKLEKLDKEITDVLSQKKFYRVYTRKDQDVKNKINDVINGLKE